MSNIALSYVWKHSQQHGSALLVLIAIADAANDDGECYPGVSRLADKCRMKERNLQYIIRDLEASGELAVDYFQGVNTKRGPTNRYRVILDGVQSSVYGVQQSAPVEGDGVQGIAPVRVQQSAPNPIVEPKEKKKTSLPKKTATVSTPPVPDPEPLAKDDSDPASFDDWMIWLDKAFQVGVSSGRAHHMYNMFKGRSKTGEWAEYNISPPALLEEAKAWVRFEKQEYAYEHNGEEKLLYSKAEAIQSRFYHWRGRHAVDLEERARHEAAEKLFREWHPELYPQNGGAT